MARRGRKKKQGGDSDQPVTPDADRVKAAIKEVANKATPEHRALVEEIQAKAKEGEKTSAVYVLPPEVCAVLFLENNGYNREWKPTKCEEYARRMLEGLWEFNNATAGFFTDGVLEDAQHRFSGAALAYYTLTTVIVFGIERRAITTVDCAVARQAADHAQMQGITDARRKQAIVKGASTYLVRAHYPNEELRSPAEVTNSIVANNKMLETAMDIGSSAYAGVASPCLSEPVVQTIAYVKLKVGRPENWIRGWLGNFLLGQSTKGESEPKFVSAKELQASKDSKRSADKLRPIEQMAYVIHALNCEEKGIVAVKKSDFKNLLVADYLPDPGFPHEDEEDQSHLLTDLDAAE
jgi:hypothetical protein